MEECKWCRSSGGMCADCRAGAEALERVQAEDRAAWMEAITLLEDELDERRYREQA